MCNKAILGSRNIKLTTFDNFVCWFWSWSFRHIFNHPKDLLFWNWTKKCQHQSTCFGVIVSRENPTNLLWNTRSQSKKLVAIQQKKSLKGSPQWTAWPWHATKRRGTPAAIQTLLHCLATNKQRYLEQGICDPGQLDQISSGWKVVEVEVHLYFHHLWTVYVWFHFIGWGRLLVHLEHIWTIPVTKTIEFVNTTRLEYRLKTPATCEIMWNNVKLVLLTSYQTCVSNTCRRSTRKQLQELIRVKGCRLKKIFQLPNSNKKSCASLSRWKNKNIYTPWNEQSPWKSIVGNWLEDGTSFWNSPFLGDMLIFAGYMVYNYNPRISRCIENVHHRLLVGPSLA